MSTLKIYAVIAILIILMTVAGAGHLRAHALQAELDAMTTKAAAAELARAGAALDIAEFRAKRSLEIDDASTKHRAALAIARAATAGAADSLRVRATAAWADYCPGASADGPPAAGASDMPADVLGRLADAAGRLAAVADERGAAGDECVARHDALK